MSELSARLQVRVTAIERAKFQESASGVGLTVSEWVRQVCRQAAGFQDPGGEEREFRMRFSKSDLVMLGNATLLLSIEARRGGFEERKLSARLQSLCDEFRSMQRELG